MPFATMPFSPDLAGIIVQAAIRAAEQVASNMGTSYEVIEAAQNVIDAAAKIGERFNGDLQAGFMINTRTPDNPTST